MSGAQVQLVAKGVQDVFILDSVSGEFPFKTMYARHRNFAVAPKLLPVLGAIQVGGSSVIQIPSVGDLITGIWIEGTNLSSGLVDTKFELYIGGQLIDTQYGDYMTYVQQVFMCENLSKVNMHNSPSHTTNDSFYPLHFFFCDNDMFLPLLAMQNQVVEIRVTWGTSVTPANISTVYGNYVYIDTADRKAFTDRTIDILVTQVQKTMSTVPTNIDLSVFNHPVKTIFFGTGAGSSSDVPVSTTSFETFSFSKADILINGQYLLEQMSPSYFYTSQLYYNTKNGLMGGWNSTSTSTAPGTGYSSYTGYFMYSFALDSSSYKPTGTCNFSRIDNMKLNIVSPVKVTYGTTVTTPSPITFYAYNSDPPTDLIRKTINSPSPTVYTPTLSTETYTKPITIYAINYNVLRVKSGLSGILFGN